MTSTDAIRSASEIGQVDRFPLSCQQSLWCSYERRGAFGPRFIVTKALRVTGRMDVEALRGALDELVVRHEILRTTVVCDAGPPYQRVYPPAPVPLEVRHLPTAPRRRAEAAEQLLAEAELSSVPIGELPLLRCRLTRFDDTDSVLCLVSHHTACDAWSLNLLVRDLAAGYAARTGQARTALEPAPQYREYTEWQLTYLVSEQAAEHLAYWHDQLRDARVFSLPTDRPVRVVHDSPYRSHRITIGADVAELAAAAGRAARSSRFMVVLAAFAVLAARIGGTSDPVINTMIHGRGQREFSDTVGPFLNFLAMRTDLAPCTTFTDVVRATRTTCVRAYQHEVPIRQIEQAIPSLMACLDDPRDCDFIVGYFEAPFRADGGGPDPLLIGERTEAIRKRQHISEEMPGGAAWNMFLTETGEISGVVQYNPDEFDPTTIAGWVEDYVALFTAAVRDPAREWRDL